MKLFTARVVLFTIWAALFLVYVVMMLCTSLKRGVTAAQATEAAWSTSYVLLPVLTAFASFFFAPVAARRSKKAAQLEEMVVGRGRLYVMFVVTGVVHVVVLLYFVLFLLVPDWADEYTQTRTFDETLSAGLKWLVLLSSLAVLPVGWLLSPESPVAISVAAPQPPSTKL